MDAFQCIENELVRLHNRFIEGDIHDGMWQEQTSLLYGALKEAIRTTEGATQNSLGDELPDDSEVEANREMIG